MQRFFSILPILFMLQSLLAQEVSNFTFEQVGNDNGKLPGQFSVAPGVQVCFSKGNLQYQASTDTWRFAENQWDYIGEDNKYISATNISWIDLFGWGTGNMPTNRSMSNGNYPSFVDWGTNPINNGGYEVGQWRTLTQEEWSYLFNGRVHSAELFGLGQVVGVKGVILLPDNWVKPSSVSFYPSVHNGLKLKGSYYTCSSCNHYVDNSYTAAEWQAMAEAGAVFLPAAGEAYGTTVRYSTSNGYYWSSTILGAGMAYCLCFFENKLGSQEILYRYYRHSVRLVQVLKK